MAVRATPKEWMDQFYDTHQITRDRTQFRSKHWVDNAVTVDQKMLACSVIKLIQTNDGPAAVAIYQATVNKLNNFDARPCRHYHGRTWGDMRRLADHWCFMLRNNIPHPTVLNHTILRCKHGGRAKEHIALAMAFIIPYVIGKFAYGHAIEYVRAETLATWGTEPRNQRAHQYFVRPLMAKWYTIILGKAGMDTFTKFMGQDLKRAEERISKKIKRFGYWSKEKMLMKVVIRPRNLNGTRNNNPNRLTRRNIHDCKGVEYSFGRCLEHFSQDFHRAVNAVEGHQMRRSLRSVTRIQERNWDTDWNTNRGMIVERMDFDETDEEEEEED